MCSYPDSSDLRKLKRWKFAAFDDVTAWLDFARSLWAYPDRWPEPPPGTVYQWVSTGGWSGNEEIIAAMADNFMWTMVCEATRSGGHYVLKNPAVDCNTDAARAQLRSIFESWVI